ncbi:hypothetical protein B0T21DRAFT_348751 [Apiosordaria backusii]|uniref:Uncharacterized protein n=1 Tax=Apiosordaria backusii TaxID=314023 RepID=A0AA40BM18_9PEZI|nr:hypothetical protein B0T21DRAFT_348751 [Apiosordaria backusii]
MALASVATALILAVSDWFPVENRALVWRTGTCQTTCREELLWRCCAVKLWEASRKVAQQQHHMAQASSTTDSSWRWEKGSCPSKDSRSPSEEFLSGNIIIKIHRNYINLMIALYLIAARLFNNLRLRYNI